MIFALRPNHQPVSRNHSWMATITDSHRTSETAIIVRIGFRGGTSHTLIVPSSSTVAKDLPSGAYIAPSQSVKVAISSPLSAFHRRTTRCSVGTNAETYLPRKLVT